LLQESTTELALAKSLGGSFSPTRRTGDRRRCPVGNRGRLALEAIGGERVEEVLPMSSTAGPTYRRIDERNFGSVHHRKTHGYEPSPGAILLAETESGKRVRLTGRNGRPEENAEGNGGASEKKHPLQFKRQTPVPGEKL